MITVQLIDGITNDHLWAVAATEIDANGNPTGAGAFSNNDGAIQLPGPGLYFFEQQGYADKAQQITAPITVELLPVTDELGEFTFTGDRPKRSHWPLWFLAGAIIADQA